MASVRRHPKTVADLRRLWRFRTSIRLATSGGDTVRDLQMYLHPEAEHLLDWFHISMRVTVMGQMANGLTAQESTDASGDVEK
jgi:hypothetical protein